MKAALRYTENEGSRNLASTSTKREHAQPKKVNEAHFRGGAQLNLTRYLSHCLALPLMGLYLADLRSNVRGLARCLVIAFS